MPKNKLTTQTVARLAATAALYAALTIALQPISFGLINLRLSEIMMLLCFYRRDYSIALALGCFIANCFSPMALMDMTFGTLATIIAAVPMFSVKNIWAASLLPVISNAAIIGIELHLAYSWSWWLGMLTVGVGELIVITAIGCPLFKFVLQKNSRFMRIIGAKNIGSAKPLKCCVKTLDTSELHLLLPLFDYNNPEKMLAENARDINDGKIDIFGLFQDGRLIGEIHAAYTNKDERFAVINKRAYLFAFRIHKDFQGEGYGQYLINDIISRLSEKGYCEFTIGVEDNNKAALHIYSKLGFTQLIGKISEEYQGDRYEYSLYLKA